MLAFTSWIIMLLIIFILLKENLFPPSICQNIFRLIILYFSLIIYLEKIIVKIKLNSFLSLKERYNIKGRKRKLDIIVYEYIIRYALV